MLKGLGNLGDMAGMMKKAQAMQKQMEEMQEQLHVLMVTGESGAGLVKATCTAKGELKGLDIDPSIFQPDEKEVVEDLILAAIKDAQGKASQRAQDEMTRITESLGLPADMKLPF
ncbi:YbaB/EbfC family nucleoid-associated protein [Lentibacter algarum]|uniref:YbaB/EbfC family nucleoid-associated protein n=1 Tax=Lentibacter algarum TaxID=576131 RepID=UPI001C079C3D|nr:YbaB/EbfC family nucleoid-associated protein [Lentibacter algarum]MBU2981508.1 YbaB/EbfC family nucleoid-associated protein [Lentibacter algarum]